MSYSTSTHGANLTAESLEAVIDGSKVDLSRLHVYIESSDDLPSFAETDLSFEEDDTSSADPLEQLLVEEPYPSLYRPTSVPRRPPLSWEFDGLTIWVELEEFDSDMTNVISDLSSTFGVQAIPQSHATAIYGMTHLTVDEAKRKLQSFVRDRVEVEGPSGGGWPPFRKPVGIVQDVAVCGNPGQVCSIAWAQLTLASSPEHEEILDGLFDTMYGEGSKEGASRARPWTPHNSVVYDNPEETVLTLEGTLECIGRYPTLLRSGRRVKALSLWDTKGRMEQWKFLDRASFF